MCATCYPTTQIQNKANIHLVSVSEVGVFVGYSLYFNSMYAYICKKTTMQVMSTVNITRNNYL